MTQRVWLAATTAATMWLSHKFSSNAAIEILPEDSAVPGYHLVQAQVVFRHGARTPLKQSYPGLSIPPASFWGHCRSINQNADDKSTNRGHIYESSGAPPDERDTKLRECGPGQLTQHGEQQAESLGSLLRHRYVTQYGLVSGLWNGKGVNSELSIRSTDTERTMLTGANVLRGFYHPICSLTVDEALRHIHVPHKLNSETMFPNYWTCPRLAEVYTERQQQLFAAGTSLHGLKEQLWAHYGEGGDKEKMSLLFGADGVRCMQSHGMPLTSALSPLHVENLKNASALQFHTIQSSNLRLGIGSFLHELLVAMTPWLGGSAQTTTAHNPTPTLSKGNSLSPSIYQSAGQPDKSALLLYSGHDSSVQSLLAAVGSKVIEWPPFCSFVAVELYERNLVEKTATAELPATARQRRAAAARRLSSRNLPQFHVRVLYKDSPENRCDPVVVYSDSLDKFKGQLDPLTGGLDMPRECGPTWPTNLKPRMEWA
jgi:hypothetical protein